MGIVNAGGPTGNCRSFPWAQCEDDDHAHEPSSTQSGKIKVLEASPLGVSTPSTASLVRSVHATGFSMAEVEGEDELLQNSDARAHIIAGTTPLAMEPANRAARRLIESLVDLSSGIWTGPLPKPRISPPLALGDCLVKDCCMCSGDHRTKPAESSQSFQISNSVATVQAQLGESNEPNQLVLIQSDHSWARFHLSKALGHFLARKGTLPVAYRRSSRRDIPAATHHHPLYVDMLKRGIPSMAGNGLQGHVGGHDNMFNDNRGGFGGNPGGGGGGPYFGDGRGQTRGEL
jgi:hypothetical protein